MDTAEVLEFWKNYYFTCDKAIKLASHSVNYIVIL